MTFSPPALVRYSEDRDCSDETAGDPSRRRRGLPAPQGERLKYLILLSPEPVRAEVTRSMNGFSHSLPIEMTSMGDSSFVPTAEFRLNLRVRLERHDGR